MLKWLGFLLVIACILVPQASAKGPIVLCGVDGCRRFGEEGAFIRFTPEAYRSHVRPVAPASFFKLQFADHPLVLAYWIPSAGVLRVSDQGGPAMWVRPSADDSAALGQLSSGLRPFAAPKRAAVSVDSFDVRRGAATYLRLFTMGVRVTKPVRAGGWLTIDIWGDQTPWTDNSYWMWIARAGPFVRHVDGDVLRISPRVAQRIRNRLPLDG